MTTAFRSRTQLSLLTDAMLALLPLAAHPAAAAPEFVCLELCAVEKQPTRTVTTPSASDVAMGESVWDHANVSALLEIGEVSVAAHVDFYVCAVDVVPCATNGTLLGSVHVVNGTADSPAFVPTEPGTYCFRGEYSGDAEYAPSSDSSRDECFTVHASVPFFPTTTGMVLGLLGATGIVGMVVYGRRRAA